MNRRIFRCFAISVVALVWGGSGFTTGEPIPQATPSAVSRAHARPAWCCGKSGVISIEAEKGTGTWEEVPGRSGEAVRDPGKGQMTYLVNFSQSGKYYLWLLASAGTEDKGKNACSILLSGQKIYSADGSVRPSGIEINGDWEWTSLPEQNGEKASNNSQSAHAYVLIGSPGIRTLQLVHQGTGFTIDKIVLKREDQQKPQGNGPAETICERPPAPPVRGSMKP